jgi:hypothetical protein
MENELKKFVKSFTGNPYKAIWFDPSNNIVSIENKISFQNLWNQNSKNVNPIILDFQNDQFLIKKLCAYFSLIKPKSIKIDLDSFFEIVDVALFDYLENQDFISTYLSWLKKHSYKQIYERLSPSNKFKDKNFLEFYPELKSKLQSLFLDYKIEMKE